MQLWTTHLTRTKTQETGIEKQVLHDVKKY